MYIVHVLIHSLILCNMYSIDISRTPLSPPRIWKGKRAERGGSLEWISSRAETTWPKRFCRSPCSAITTSKNSQRSALCINVSSAAPINTLKLRKTSTFTFECTNVGAKPRNIEHKYWLLHSCNMPVTTAFYCPNTKMAKNKQFACRIHKVWDFEKPS